MKCAAEYKVYKLKYRGNKGTCFIRMQTNSRIFNNHIMMLACWAWRVKEK